ncbi:MAG TPA: adenylosuccinate synthase [Longimicrobiales bacterium]|nr:adenylosuccinate synthase [Longimicrobiales bacterium]
MDTSYKCRVVVGAQWGDEGKGKIVDVLASEADVVARYQGGANAGHTVHVAGDEFILHQIPSGILHADQRCLLGNGVVLDLEQFFEELDGLQDRGLDAEPRLGVSGRAHLLLDYHKHLDLASEARRGEAKIGTTGKGIGPAYEDKVARRGVRVGDLRDADRATDLIRRAASRANERLEGTRIGPVDVDTLVDRVLRLRERLLPLVTDVGHEIHTAITAGCRVLLEGAQGALLDIDHGTYPYVTSSNTTAAGAATGAGVGPTAIDSVLGVVKAYTTRVGSGPFPTELFDEDGVRLQEIGGEIGVSTGRTRRCGWYDAVIARYAARVNGLTEFFLTKLDVLDHWERIPVCVAYEVDGQRVEEMPMTQSEFHHAEPIYEYFDGWGGDISGCRSFEDLPVNAQRYVQALEELSGAPIWGVGVGPGREETIVVHPA